MKTSFGILSAIYLIGIIFFIACKPNEQPGLEPNILGDWKMENLKMNLYNYRNNQLSGTLYVEDDGTRDGSLTEAGKMMIGNDGVGLSDLSSFYLFNPYYGYLFQDMFYWERDEDTFTILQDSLESPTVWRIERLNDKILIFTWTRIEGAGPNRVERNHRLTLTKE